MPELVISNTSPLFYLHRLRHLEVLQALYQQIIVPEAVRDELHIGHIQGEDTPELADYDWITIRSVQVPEVLTLITDLGAGEAQVLALALEESGSLVILDDRFARAVLSGTDAGAGLWGYRVLSTAPGLYRFVPQAG